MRRGSSAHCRAVLGGAASITVACLLSPGQVRAYDVSAPAILQDFESSYLSIENKLPDLQAAGFGQVYLPPPGLTTNGLSVGYDVYDRFNLGTAAQPTLYGTQNEFAQVVKDVHQIGGNVYADLLWNSSGEMNLGTSGFAASGGYPGLAVTLQDTNPNAPGYNTQGINDVDGDYHSAYDSSTYGQRVAGLDDIAQEKQYYFIRNPTTAGNPLNIPAGTTPWNGYLANVPTASNAQFYPDLSGTSQTLYDAGTGQTFTRYNFNTANPLSGTAVAEDAQGYLERYAQWMVQVLGVDGFRVDAAKNMEPSVLNYLDQAVYNASNRTLLNGQRQQIFSFSEVYDSSFATNQAYIAKPNPSAPANEVQSDRDVEDYPLYFAMAANLTSSTSSNNWYNVYQASIDVNDDGLMNGSQGVKFVSNQDVTAPALSNVASAYTLMLPGNAMVYYNGRNFNNESQSSSGGEFPEGGGNDPFNSRGDALGGPYGNTITTLVDLRNRYGRGDYHVDFISQNFFAFERQNSALVMLSNSSTPGFDSETFATKFPAGTYLLEQTGNAGGSYSDPNGDIPKLLIVGANGVVNARFLNNATYTKGGGSTYSTGDGDLVYGLPTPQSQNGIVVTNVSSVMAGNTFSTSASNTNQNYQNGTERFANVDVVTAPTFQIQLSTQPAYLLGNTAYHDFDADGDNALFKVDDGSVILNGDAALDNTTPGTTSYGYQAFRTASTPGYGNIANGYNGYYAQSINTAGLSIGYHYLSTIAYRHSDDTTAPPVYTDWSQTIYVDRGTPSSTIASFAPFASSAGTYENRQLVINNTDTTASSEYVFLNLPAGLTTSQILQMVSTGNVKVDGVTYTGGAAGQIDQNEFAYGFNNIPNGNNEATVITYRPDGNYAIQRFSADSISDLGHSTLNGYGLGFIDGSSSLNDQDVLDFDDEVKANAAPATYQQLFDPAADLNGDGLVDLTDFQEFGSLLTRNDAPAGVMAYYQSLLQSVPEPGSAVWVGAGLLIAAARGRQRIVG